jgi:hypothetical protein
MEKPNLRLTHLAAACLILTFSLNARIAVGQDEPEFQINPGLSGAWFNPETSGQGFVLEVFPDIKQVFLAWFTYNNTQPGQGTQAEVGDPGHRWLTAQGPYDGDTANLTVFLTTGGLFDDPSPVTNTPEGTITLTFQDCTAGTVEYSLTAAAVSGSVPISRPANDNVALCASMDGVEDEVSENNSKNSNRPAAAGNPAPLAEITSASANFEINAGHSGAWFNQATSGQGYVMEVFPDIKQVFLAWFTYNNSQPGQGTQAEVGDPGHRWLTAQGPFDGNTANLSVFLTTGGLFDDPSPVTNTPEGTVTLTFQDCIAGTVDYDLTAAAVSGSVPISRPANDNVALCESLSTGIVLEEERKQSAVLGIEGGAVEVADTQSNVMKLTIPEGVLIGTRDQLIEVTPLSRQTTLPTGQPAIAGVHWSTGPGDVIGPAKLEVLTAEAERFTELAAFAFTPGGENFYFTPLVLGEEVGVVLEVPMVSPGTFGVASVTADQMEQWPPPADPPAARHLQEMAIAIKRAVESASVESYVEKTGSTPEQLITGELARTASDQSIITEFILPQAKEWFDEDIGPGLGLAMGGCEKAAEFVKSTFPWVAHLQYFGLEDHPELAGRIDSLRNAVNEFDGKSNNDIGGIDDACSMLTDPCKQMEAMKEASVCAQIRQSLGFETSEEGMACKDAPTLLKVEPNISEVCPGATINFSASVSNFNGTTVPVEQVGLRWESGSPDLLTVDSQSGAAEALEEGTVFVNATSEVCGEDLAGIAYVQIEGVPDILGSYSVVGSETVVGCEFDEDNGSFGGRGTATIWLQTQNENPDAENFSGVGTAVGLGEDFSGTIQCGGAVTGMGSYTEMDPCGEEICTTSGTTTFVGSLIGNTIKVDTTAQDISGDTCSANGWATATRNQ